MTLSGRPEVLLAASTWWPLSARLAMGLRDAGCQVHAVCPPGHPMRAIGGIGRLFTYRRSDSLDALRQAIGAARPQVIVPCDDGVVWQLHELHSSVPALRGLIERSLGPAEMYPIVRGREQLLSLASELGIRVPRTQRIDSAAELQAWLANASTPGVLKLDRTWGGQGVHIAGSRQDAMDAWHRFSRRPGAAFACKRWFVNHDPLALWAWRSRIEPVVTIQEAIAGQPANTMFVCERGEILALVTVKVLSAQGATGAANIVQLMANEEMERAARLLVKRLQLSGFGGLDFMLEAATGAAYLIELNPRCTQLGHLRLPNQASLAETFGAMLGGRATPNPAPAIASDIVAFFPQAFEWEPTSPHLLTGHHDVPWGEPQLVRDVLRPPWPNRQWPARIYHGLRPLRRGRTMGFGEVESSLI